MKLLPKATGARGGGHQLAGDTPSYASDRELGLRLLIPEAPFTSTLRVGGSYCVLHWLVCRVERCSLAITENGLVRMPEI